MTHASPVDDAGLAELTADYELLGELGRGGSAVVYRARDRRLGREVALKAVRLAPALPPAERAAEVARLAREARTTARLAHPHIVTVYAVHELRDGLAVAMQCVAGPSLKQLVAAEGALEPARAARLLAEVAEALAYAHAHRVVHRDVKPENIFVDAATGRALLADFGAARAGDADVRVTRTGATVGTPAYMSPEQIDGAAVDGRADLYSLGLVAWEVLTGRRPWEGAGLFQLLHHQKYDALPPVAAVRPASLPPVPLALEYVVARLLEKRAAARWASAAVVAEQLVRPVLPADYPAWVRAHRRRLAEEARGGGPPAGVSTSAPTEQFGPGTLPDGLAAAGVGEGDAPSWAQPNARRKRVWLTAGAVLTASVAALPFVLRSSPPPPRTIERPPVRAAIAVPAAPTAPAPTRPAPTTPTPAGAPGATRPDSAAGTVEARPAARAAVVASAAASATPATGPDSAARPAGDSVRRTVVALGRPAVRAAPAAPPPPAARAEPAATPAPAPTSGPARPILFAGGNVIAAGGRHTCALDGAGRASCWGANENGQLGATDLSPRDAPTSVAGDLRFTQIATGGAHTCALTAAGDAYCWGDGDQGQLGTTSALRDAPTRVPAPRLRALAAGLDHTCALTAAGAVLCWGADDAGQLGDGSARDRATPAPVAGISAAALAVGWRHSCALTAAGAAWCWGDNTNGQLGDGTRTTRRTPTAVAGGTGPFVAIAAGAAHTCATTADGRTYCWGAGGADPAPRLPPTAVPAAPPFVALTAGATHTCGRTAAGAVFCWGRNPYGQLGDGTTADRWRPARVPGGPYFAVSAAGAHTCAVADGAPVCWGYNVSGQLGDGTRAHHATPTRVARTAP